MTTGAESERQRSKRHYQRVLFDGIADRYAAFRPGYPARVTDLITATAGSAPGPRSWKSAAVQASSPGGWPAPGPG